MNNAVSTAGFDANQRFWKALTKDWPDGVIDYRADGTITTASPAACRILGWQEQEMRGNNIHEMLCSQSRKYYHEPDDCPLIHSHTPDKRYESAWKKHDGAQVVVQYRIAEFNTADIFFDRMVVFQDTSHFKFQTYDKKKL